MKEVTDEEWGQSYLNFCFFDVKNLKKGKNSPEFALSPWEIIQIVEDLLDGHPGGQSTWPGSLKPDPESVERRLIAISHLEMTVAFSS